MTPLLDTLFVITLCLCMIMLCGAAAVFILRR